MSKFDWDDGNREKCARRVPLEEIEALIDDPRTMIAGDPYEGETRFRAIGRDAKGRPLFVVFTMREGRRVVRSPDQRSLSPQGQTKVKKPLPRFTSDDEVEAFLDANDIEDFDLAKGALPRDEWFQRYERFAKDSSIHLRLPSGLLDAVRAQATKENIPTQRLIREYIERGLRERKGAAAPKKRA